MRPLTPAERETLSGAVEYLQRRYGLTLSTIERYELKCASIRFQALSDVMNAQLDAELASVDPRDSDARRDIRERRLSKPHYELTVDFLKNRYGIDPTDNIERVVDFFRFNPPPERVQWFQDWLKMRQEERHRP